MTEPTAASTPPADDELGMYCLLVEHPAADDEPIIYAADAEVTAAALRASVEQLGATLTDMGVQPGQSVVAVVNSTPDAIAAMFGIWGAGAVYVPLNARSSDGEINALIVETSPAVVVGDADDLARLGITSGCVVTSGQLGWASTGTANREAPVTDRDVALVMRTSGTTGESKAVELRHSGTLEGMRSMVRELTGGRTGPRKAPTPNLIPVSLALWSGIYNVIFAYTVGAPVVLLPKFTTEGMAEAVRRFNIRSTVLAPPMVQMLAADQSITDLSPLKFVRSITAPLSPAQARYFFERFGVPVLNSYGQTELGGEVVGWKASDVREFGDSKLGAAGRAHADVSIRILGEDGERLAQGESGEVWAQSPSLMRGYANDAEMQDRLVDGHLQTGDIGRVDEDGFLWIDGRISDMINRGGLKIVPDQVEQVIAAHRSVTEACVAGVPDERVGEVPVAWIVEASAVSDEELEAWCRESLVAYKVPVDFVRVDALPRSEIGKVLRADLQRNYEP